MKIRKAGLEREIEETRDQIERNDSSKIASLIDLGQKKKLKKSKEVQRILFRLLEIKLNNLNFQLNALMEYSQAHKLNL